MDRLLSSGNALTDNARDREPDGVKPVEGHAVVVGSRAHLVKSEAVVKVRETM
jgi:hypothetical protein